MKETISRRITKTASVVIILVLLIGGTIYFRTVSNAENLDNRNLRELTRIGQGVEGRVNNLKRVMENLAGASYSELVDKEKLIPNFKIDTLNTVRDSKTDTIRNLSAGRTAFKTDIASSSLQLWHRYTSKTTKDDSKSVKIPEALSASYGFESLRPILSSDYMETIFLADETGSIFIWETERTGVRIHELAALDTLYFKGNGEGGPMGKSDILQTTIAGQEYRFYLHPVRVHLSEMQNMTVSESEYTKWILGGIVPQSEYGQKSLSLDPNMALFLGFLVIAGFLIVPFVRILTMGPKERLRVGNLFYLVIALIFGAGLAGLWMADIVHYSPLNENTKNQLKETADTMALNIDSELQAALKELRKRTKTLNDTLDSANLYIDSIEDGTDNDSSYLMREKIEFDKTGTYPYYQMVFWTDSKGMQKAKWTPRANNTPRINVDQREYFKAIAENRGWDQKFYDNPDSTTCSNIIVPNSDSLRYYLESIRSWNTGENVAAISIPLVYKDSTNRENVGIAALTTELASLTTPVLPAGVGFAIVDANAKTLFHTRQERILDENFAEETARGDLLMSILAARACAELEMNYEGQSRLMSIRPLNGRPLFLILFKDLSLIDTVRFEAWFEGGTLLGIWVFMIFLLIFFLELLPSSRMDWMWPDLKNPGKYTIFTVYSIPFIVLLILKAMTEEHLHIHKATLITPYYLPRHGTGDFVPRLFFSFQRP